MAVSRNRTPRDAVIDAVAAALAAASVGAGQRLAVAFSGGVDSTVLLHALAGLRERFGFDLHAAHVHHGLSPNADAWLAFCRRRCCLLGVAFHPFLVDVARDDPAGLEAAARSARRAAFAMLDCDWLVLGHHRDDQAETLLFRLLRGSGVHGAAAMAAVEPGSPGRLRPLLDVGRADIVAFARAAGLEWVEDESNTDAAFARNFLRHDVFPLLDRAFPGGVPSLARAAGNFREAAQLLDELAEIDAAACGGTPFARERLLAHSDERARNLLRWQIRGLGVEAPPRSRLVEALRQLRESQDRPLRVDLGGAALCAYRSTVWVEPEARLPPPVAVAWHGEAALRWGAGRVEFEPAVGAGLSRAKLDRAGDVALVARWPSLAFREGERRPRRSFKNLCQEAGIPAWLRDGLPVLRVDGEAAWIGDLGVAVEFRAGPDEPGLIPRWCR